VIEKGKLRIVKIGNMNEKAVAGLWQKSAPGSFYWWQEKRVELVYPGRQSAGGGCDFEDAVFLIDGKRITGNVEIHIRTSGWFVHRHHLDPRYSEVALHVVLEDDDRLKTVDASGRLVPTIALGKSNKGQPRKLPAGMNYCRRSTGAFHNRIFQVIYEAAAARLADKTARFRNMIAVEEPGQVLYRSLARALGYSRNSIPFEELARALPLDKLQKCMATGDKNQLKARLAGTAGLLPSQRSAPCCGDEESVLLEKAWAEAPMENGLSLGCWTNNGLRPQNRPIRRIMAMAELLWRFRDAGLEAGILGLLSETGCTNDAKRLTDRLVVNGEGYWAYHLDFGLPFPRPGALLGKPRASDIIINVLLPFACARLAGDASTKKAERIYYCYPAASRNRITEYMTVLMGLEGRLNRAAELQGLLHLFQCFCRHKLCDSCPVSRIRS
jgi:hypothetical protein